LGKRASSPSSGGRARWTALVILITLLVSGIISFLSEEALSGRGLVGAFFILLAIVFVGIFFDIIGVAATSADERPFHAMASRRVPGAREAIRLLRNADRVSSICNDVIGDICGVVSGSASAAIAVRAAAACPEDWEKAVTLLMSACVAAVTVGGKSAGKTIALRSSTQIMHMAGRVLWTLERIRLPLGKEKR